MSAKSDLEAGVGCQIDSVFEVHRLDGNFHISHHSCLNTYYALMDSFPAAFERMNLSHSIVELRFGVPGEKDTLNKLRDVLEEVGLSQQLFQNHVDHSPVDASRFVGSFWLEVIPYVLVDHRSRSSFQSWQHSFNRKITVV